MSEYDELVKRLRVKADDWSQPLSAAPIGMAFGEAADAIVAMEAEIKWLTEHHNNYSNNVVRELAAAQSEVERLKEVLGDIKRNADCGGDATLFRWQTLSEITKTLEARP